MTDRVSTQIVVRMPLTMRREIQQLATAADRTLAAEVRMAVRAHLRKAASDAVGFDAIAGLFEGADDG